MHLFVSLFTIRAKVMKWYLVTKDSYDKLESLSPVDRVEFFDCINSVLADRPRTLADCVLWATNLFHRIFTFNVEKAREALKEMGRGDKRFPLKDTSDKTVRKFISTSALLLAKMYNIKDEKGNEPTAENIHQLIDYTSHSISLSTSQNEKPFIKLTKFIDMMHLDHNITKNGVLLEYPEDLADMVIKPISPFIDNALVKDFVDSTIRLRFFNFKNSFPKFSDISSKNVKIYRGEFAHPYFRWSHNFLNLI